MIKFIFILAVILPSGEVKVGSQVVDQCPEKSVFLQQMENKLQSKEIEDWQAMCYALDIGVMFGRQS